MRLTQSQQQITKATVDRIMGMDNSVWLFGSRVDDALRGGNIDLLFKNVVTRIKQQADMLGIKDDNY